VSLFARAWPRVATSCDRRGADRHRTRLLAGMSGRVVEVGAGDGRNFARYPAAVSEIVAVEPEPRLRALAEQAADNRARVLDGTAEGLPLDDGEADAVVMSLVLCTVPDQAKALAEARRVLRPGGELRFYEHVVGRGARRAVQRALDATVYPPLAGGCHLSRDTVAAIGAAGFTVGAVDRFSFNGLPHVLGTATR
jgi:ubiquinone/menaquinone biosynthesis C-methylase UbiE